MSRAALRLVEVDPRASAVELAHELEARLDQLPPDQSNDDVRLARALLGTVIDLLIADAPSSSRGR